MSGSTHTLLDHADLTFDLGDMFISGCGVEYDSGRCQFVFHRSAFTIHEHVLDSKATCTVDDLHVLEHLHELLDLAINDVLGSSELYMITYSCKERNFVDEEKVA